MECDTSAAQLVVVFRCVSISRARHVTHSLTVSQEMEILLKITYGTNLSRISQAYLRNISGICQIVLRYISDISHEYINIISDMYQTYLIHVSDTSETSITFRHILGILEVYLTNILGMS